VGEVDPVLGGNSGQHPLHRRRGLIVHRRRDVAWAFLFCVALIGNVATLPYGAHVYQTFVEQDRMLTIEQKVAPFRIGVQWATPPP
jgi:hypothetical protein